MSYARTVAGLSVFERARFTNRRQVAYNSVEGSKGDHKMSEQKKMGDMLKEFPYDPKTAPETIFRLQKEFAGRFTPFKSLENQDNPNTDDLYKYWIDEFVLCCEDELSEILNWLPWKHWRSYQDFKFEETELKFELIDLLHFYVNLCHVTGLDSSYLPHPRQDLWSTATLGEKFAATKKWMHRMYYRLVCLQMSPHSILGLIQLREALQNGFEIWDMTDQDVFNFYMSKYQENLDRQARGY